MEKLNASLLGAQAAGRGQPRIPARLLRDVTAGGGLEAVLRTCMDRRLVVLCSKMDKNRPLSTSLLEERCLDTEAQLNLLRDIAESLTKQGSLRCPVIAFDVSSAAGFYCVVWHVCHIYVSDRHV